MTNLIKVKLEKKRFSITKPKYNDKKKKYLRTLVINFDNVEDVPVELFATKISQSTNPQKANKVVFSYLYFRENDESPNTNVPVSDKITMETDPEKIKAAYVKLAAKNPDLQVTAWITLNSPFLNVELKDGLWSVYDNNAFPSDDDRIGDNGTYIIPETRLDIHLQQGINPQYPTNPYMRVELSNKDLVAKEVFKRKEHGKVFGDEETPSIDDYDFDASADFLSDEI